MKKSVPYIVVGILLLLVLLLVVTHKGENEKIFDSRLSFDRKDKIPYGTYVAYTGLTSLFPNAKISVSRQEPGSWDSLSMYASRQALLIVTPIFDPYQSELQKLVEFASAGNDVFISTIQIEFPFTKLIKGEVNVLQHLQHEQNGKMEWDTMMARLTVPPFNTKEWFSYPGQPYNLCFSSIDSLRATVLGYGINDAPDFIHLKAGKGNFYVHLSPILFTNYFLLNKNNIRYYEQALSVIPSSTQRIVWDEYFYNKKYKAPEEPDGWFTSLMKFKSFKWALMVAIFTLLLYALMEMRRKQRIIPVIQKPVNDSMEFVKTIGRLYHERGDHANLSRKMAAYFLEQVRTRYNLPTRNLNDEFINTLHHRSGYSFEKLNSLVHFIQQVEMNAAVSDKDLGNFHKQLEDFYSAT